MRDLATAQALLRGLAYAALFGTAASLWARPFLGGMTSLEAVSVARRARHWTAIGVFGASTQIGRVLNIAPTITDLTSTVVVFAVVAAGFHALQTGRR